MNVREVEVAMRQHGSTIRALDGFPKSLSIEHPAVIASVEMAGSCGVGAFSYIGKGSEIRDTKFGRFCSVARRVCIGLVEHPIDHVSTHPIAFGGGRAFLNDPYFRSMQRTISRPVRQGTNIGHDVWIGDGAFLRRGITVGNGAIIAARAVVTKNVPPYAIVAGVPAKIVRYRFSDEVIARLLESRWWDIDLRSVGADYVDVEKCLDLLAGAKSTELKFHRSEIQRVDRVEYNVEEFPVPSETL